VDTRKNLNKQQKKLPENVDLFDELKTEKEGDLHIEVTDSQDYLIRYNFTNKPTKPVKKVLKFKFTESDIRSDIKARLVVSSNIDLQLEIFVIAPEGVSNIESNLDMKALVLHPDSNITFVPILEIDEKDVSVDHKSTIGRPNDKVLRYMRSRGYTVEKINEVLAESYLKAE
jgi:hypothetical protein